jgi:hypothetical protein
MNSVVEKNPTIRMKCAIIEFGQDGGFDYFAVMFGYAPWWK